MSATTSKDVATNAVDRVGRDEFGLKQAQTVVAAWRAGARISAFIRVRRNGGAI